MHISTDSHDKRIIASTSLVHALIHGCELTYAAVLIAISAEFGSGLFLLGIIANTFALAFGSGALPSGFLADKIGSRRLLIICLFATAITAVLVALSPNIWLLAITLTGLGIATGLYHPAGLSLITREVRRRSLGIGYHGIGGNLGVALTPLIAVGITALWGWRFAYVFLATGAICLAFLLLRLPERREEAAALPSSARSDTPGSPERFLVGRLLIVYAANTLSGFIYRGALTFLPLYITQRTDFTLAGIDSKILGGSFASVALLFGVFGQFVGGNLAERIKLEKLIVPVTAAIIPSLLIMGISGGIILLIAAASFAFFNFMGQPAYNSLVAEYSPRRFQGRSYGFSFFAAFGLGSFSAGISGFIAERLGINWVFLTLAGEGVLMLALAIYLRWASLRSQASQPATA